MLYWYLNLPHRTERDQKQKAHLNDKKYPMDIVTRIESKNREDYASPMALAEAAAADGFPQFQKYPIISHFINFWGINWTYMNALKQIADQDETVLLALDDWGTSFEYNELQELLKEIPDFDIVQLTWDVSDKNPKECEDASEHFKKGIATTGQELNIYTPKGAKWMLTECENQPCLAAEMLIQNANNHLQKVNVYHYKNPSEACVGLDNEINDNMVDVCYQGNYHRNGSPVKQQYKKPAQKQTTNVKAVEILYITPKSYQTPKAGGMGTKTQHIKSAWGQTHNIDINFNFDKEYLDTYDVILIELLGLRAENKLQERCDLLKSTSTPVLVYGSDSEVFRWKGHELDALKEVAIGWIANCQWQMNYFMDFQLPVFGVLYEPINTDLFRPNKYQEKVIITGGRVSHEKEAEFFIELFAKLKPIQKNYKTAWIGSAGGWNDWQPQNLRLEHDLRTVTDIFHGQVPQSEVATALSQSAVAVWNPRYETCHRLGMEGAASGIARIAGKHILYDEKITAGRFETVDECIELLGLLTEDFEKMPNVEEGEKLRQFAEENYSYQATLEQLNTFLRYVL